MLKRSKNVLRHITLKLSHLLIIMHFKVYITMSMLLKLAKKFLKILIRFSLNQSIKNQKKVFSADSFRHELGYLHRYDLEINQTC